MKSSKINPTSQILAQIHLQPFVTLALDGGKWCSSYTGHFIPKKEHPVLTEWVAGWAPDLVWFLEEERNLLSLLESNLGPYSV
jgi:hypothetical protein